MQLKVTLHLSLNCCNECSLCLIAERRNLCLKCTFHRDCTSICFFILFFISFLGNQAGSERFEIGSASPDVC